MPDVREHSLTAAEATLKGDGLKFQVKSTPSSAAANTVVGQTPEPDVLVRKGQTVKLTYSSGPVQVVVPGVYFEPVTTAEATLRAKGLKYKLVPVTPTNPDEQVNTVQRTVPVPGTVIGKGGTVTIYFFRGATQETIPSVVNLTPSEASLVLASHLLSEKSITYAPSATVKKGLVSGTQPPVGTKEPAGFGVVLVVSSGPPANVPNVYGLKEAVARHTILAAGLVCAVQFVTNPAFQPDYVSGQSPAAGTVVAKGSTVTIDVVEASTTTTTSTTPPTTTSTTSPTTTSTTVKSHARRG